MLTLVLTRHGLTDRSEPEQHLGQKIDIPLSAAGRAQARALGRRLAPVTFERLVTSPLARAQETAGIAAREIAAGGRPVPEIELDSRLLEMDYGQWEGLTYAELDERFRDERRAWATDPASHYYPGGESGHQVATRARAFLETLLADHVNRHGSRTSDEWRVLAVGHSSLNRVLMCVALDIPIREFRVRFVQSQVNLTVLRFEHGDGPSDARLVLLNDIGHVRTADQIPWE
jgi:probable phosphoglycerate mutase